MLMTFFFSQQFGVFLSTVMQLHRLVCLYILFRKKNIVLSSWHCACWPGKPGWLGECDHTENFPPDQDPGIAIPGSRLTRLAKLSLNPKVDFCCILQSCQDLGKTEPDRLM